MKRIETSLHYNSINPLRVGYALTDNNLYENDVYLLEKMYWRDKGIETLQEIERSVPLIKRIYTNHRTIINLREL